MDQNGEAGFEREEWGYMGSREGLKGMNLDIWERGGIVWKRAENLGIL